MSIDIVNYGSNRGWILGATLAHTGGYSALPQVSVPVEIGSTAVNYSNKHAVTLPMGKMPRLLPDVTADTDSADLITTEITFSDIGNVTTWKQRTQWRERAQISADGRPNYSYVVETASEPEIVT